MTDPIIVERWRRSRTFHHSAFPPERLAVERDATVSVCVPAKDCAATIAPIVGVLSALRELGVIDQVLVVPTATSDRTATLAAAGDAEVVWEDDLLPEFGPVLGKGDAMWRSLSAATGDVVCWVDGDSEDFGPHFVCGVVGPIVCDPGAQYVKGFYRRPFRAGETTQPHGGGRVTELTAKPLLRRFFAELSGVLQPLAGEMAGRRALFERLPFVTGYGVETALLIDVWREVGLAGLAQTDLDVRQNDHKPLDDLGAMADAVLAAALDRAGVPGAEAATELIERPPLRSVGRAAA